MNIYAQSLIIIISDTFPIFALSISFSFNLFVYPLHTLLSIFTVRSCIWKWFFNLLLLLTFFLSKLFHLFVEFSGKCNTLCVYVNLDRFLLKLLRAGQIQEKKKSPKNWIKSQKKIKFIAKNYRKNFKKSGFLRNQIRANIPGFIRAIW